MPYILPYLSLTEASPTGPHGFPLWIRYAHFFNFLFLMMLVRSGLSILMDHPRLYFNNDCTPGTEWIRFTPLTVPKDRVWTAKDDARYISPVFALPGYRHTVGVARSWHFIDVYGFIITGLIFIPLLFITGQWERVVPTSWIVLPQAWNTFVHYATFHFPPEPNGFYGYNALQQLAYFAAIFLFAPLSILDRRRDVTCNGESLSVVSSAVRRKTGRSFHPLSDDAELGCVLDRPRDTGGP